MTYGRGVGVRLDVNRNFFMKGGVERKWIDISTANGKPTFDLWRLDLGLVFFKGNHLFPPRQSKSHSYQVLQC